MQNKSLFSIPEKTRRAYPNGFKPDTSNIHPAFHDQINAMFKTPTKQQTFFSINRREATTVSDHPRVTHSGTHENNPDAQSPRPQSQTSDVGSCDRRAKS
jgi:hypothetical protein